MALDGVFLSCILKELQEAVGARVDKIHQPSREEIVITLRHRSGSEKLLINVGASSPRLHFTGVTLENPKAPPMFCMLLRKHLGGGKLTAVRQLGLDRVAYLDFEAVNELGDLVTVTLAVEIMGRHSNLIIINEKGKVIDAIKRVDMEMSSVRPVLPQMDYTLPPVQDKLNLFEADNGRIFEAVRAFPKEQALSKTLVGVLQGISPLFAREAVHYACRGDDPARSDCTDEQFDRLGFYLNRVREDLSAGTPHITMVLDRSGAPKDFCFVEVHQYGAAMLTKPYDSPCTLLDDFYSRRDQIARMKQRSNDLLKLILNRTERTQRKLEAQRQELAACGERDKLKMYGDLLNSNLYRLEKGMQQATLENFYEADCPPVTIPLDPSRTPSQNAQHYYSEYRKAATAERMLTDLIQQGEEELIYLDSVFDEVSRTTGESELLEIREELIDGGYLRGYHRKNLKQLKPKPPLRFRSSDGFTILCGRNNKQNDRLSMREARNHDVWLHTHNIPGSHVIVVTEGATPPDRTLEEAAIIAAYHSKAQGSVQVPVDYTEIRHVHKPNGAKPGMVIFENYQTAYVTPDEELVKRLAVEKQK